MLDDQSSHPIRPIFGFLLIDTGCPRQKSTIKVCFVLCSERPWLWLPLFWWVARVLVLGSQDQGRSLHSTKQNFIVDFFLGHPVYSGFSYSSTPGTQPSRERSRAMKPCLIHVLRSTSWAFGQLQAGTKCVFSVADKIVTPKCNSLSPKQVEEKNCSPTNPQPFLNVFPPFCCCCSNNGRAAEVVRRHEGPSPKRLD